MQTDKMKRTRLLLSVLMKMFRLLKRMYLILNTLCTRNVVMVLFLCTVLYSYTVINAVFEISNRQYIFSNYEHRLMEETLMNRTTLDKLRQQLHGITSNRVKSCTVVIEPRRLDLHLVVNVSGNIKCALSVTNNVLDTVRHAQLPLTSQFESIEHELFGVEHAVDSRAGNSTYLDVLSKYPNIITVLIAWYSYTAKRWDEADLPVKRFYIRPHAEVVCYDSSDSQECRDNLDFKVVFSSTPHYSEQYSWKTNDIPETKAEKDINNYSNKNISSKSDSDINIESGTRTLKTKPESNVIHRIDNNIKTGSDINALSGSNIKTSSDSNKVGLTGSDTHKRETKTQKIETESAQSTMPHKSHSKSTWTYPFFVHIIHNGHINDRGRVSTGPLDITPFECQKDKWQTRKYIWRRVLVPFYGHSMYNEVFIISQYWGGGVFHLAIEDLPRLAPYYKFLQANPQIYIHATDKHPQFEVLGIDMKRIITGPVKAKVIYMPQGGGCGWLNPGPGQLIAQKYHSYIQRKFPQNLHRNSIILIKRTAKRYLDQHNEISKILISLAQEYNMDFKLFPDDPVPSFNATLQMFHSARLVVAPHGAGLANVIFSRPRTGIIEILCTSNPNFCYQSVAKSLGHVYMGLLSVKKVECGPLYVDIPYFIKVVTNFIRHLGEDQDSI